MTAMVGARLADTTLSTLAGRRAPHDASRQQAVRQAEIRRLATALREWGGDRALNKAIHTIAHSRMRTDSTTEAYVVRRRAQAKSDREIRRCINRYITRQLFRILSATMSPTTPVSA